jgi:hypothetical protein
MDSGSSLGSFYGVWLLIFLIIKVGGTALASWSWLWVLLPIVPDLVLLFRKLGWL